jgi:hypothetical protein
MAKSSEEGDGEYARTNGWREVLGHAVQCDTWNCRNANVDIARLRVAHEAHIQILKEK